MATRSLPFRASSSAALDSARSAGRDIFGRFTGGARRLGQGMVSRSAAASAALARTGEKDTLGGVFARTLGPGAVALGAGVLDASAAGDWVREKTGGWLDASTAAGIIGGVAHGFKLDGWLHPSLRKANRTMLSGIVPVWLYKRGLAIPGIVSGRMGESGGAPQISGTSEATAPAAAPQPQEQPEPIPGETTVS